jgi:hypothetical protein
MYAGEMRSVLLVLALGCGGSTSAPSTQPAPLPLPSSSVSAEGPRARAPGPVGHWTLDAGETKSAMTARLANAEPDVQAGLNQALSVVDTLHLDIVLNEDGTGTMQANVGADADKVEHATWRRDGKQIAIADSKGKEVRFDLDGDRLQGTLESKITFVLKRVR